MVARSRLVLLGATLVLLASAVSAAHVHANDDALSEPVIYTPTAEDHMPMLISWTTCAVKVATCGVAATEAYAAKSLTPLLNCVSAKTVGAQWTAAHANVICSYYLTSHLACYCASDHWQPAE